MGEILLAALIAAIVAYPIGYITGVSLTRKRERRLRALYSEAITAARYVSGVVEASNHREGP